MEQLFGYLYVGIIHYLIPCVLAIGLIFWLYGAFNYFVLGPGEEAKREEGRGQLMWSFLIFLLGLSMYLFVAAVIWFVQWADTAVHEVHIDEDTRVQPVPNVPRRNN